MARAHVCEEGYVGQGGFSPVKTDHSRGEESGSKCHMRGGYGWQRGSWGAERDHRPPPPPARLNTICRGIREKSDCKGGRD